MPYNLRPRNITKKVVYPDKHKYFLLTSPKYNPSVDQLRHSSWLRKFVYTKSKGSFYAYIEMSSLFNVKFMRKLLELDGSTKLIPCKRNWYIDNFPPKPTTVRWVPTEKEYLNGQRVSETHN